MAGTISTIRDAVRDKGDVREITFACKAHTDNSFSVSCPISIQYWNLYMVKTWPGGTAPKDASDLTITSAPSDGEGFADDILGGAGTDQIDATSTLNFVPLIGGQAAAVPLLADAYTIAVTNNDVASATFFIKLILVRSL
jgi:hypothetical protein